MTDELAEAFRHLESLLMAAASPDPGELVAATGEVMTSDVTREVISVAAHACDVVVNYIAWMRGSTRGAVLAEMFQSRPFQLADLWLEIAAFLEAS